VASAPANSIQRGSCQPSYPLCGYVQDLFIDNVLQSPAGSLSSLTNGSWYLDRSKSLIYIPTNPAGHTIELGNGYAAFYGPAKGVQVRNLTVEKYATPSQAGAIGGNPAGSNWTVQSVEVRWNHGAGVELGTGSQLLGSFVHHNGQLGVGVGGSNCKVVNNEISWNNYAGFSIDWEAGGTKFWATTNLLVQSNNVHDNLGRGLWTDTDNVGTLYDSNTVTNNL
jgi:hypothetical protein